MDVAYKICSPDVHNQSPLQFISSPRFIDYLNDFEFDYLSVFSMIRYALGIRSLAMEFVGR